MIASAKDYILHAAKRTPQPPEENEFFTTYRPDVPLARDPGQHKDDMKKKRLEQKEAAALEAQSRAAAAAGSGTHSTEVTEGDRYSGMDVAMELIKPFLEKARAPGCVPRRDVVPQMRSAGVPVQAIKLFKRVLRSELISLDGGKLEPGQSHPSLPRKSKATRLEVGELGRGEAEDEEEEEEEQQQQQQQQQQQESSDRRGRGNFKEESSSGGSQGAVVNSGGDEGGESRKRGGKGSYKEERDWCALGRKKKCEKQKKREAWLQKRIENGEAKGGGGGGYDAEAEAEQLPEGVKEVEYERDWKGRVRKSGPLMASKDDVERSRQDGKERGRRHKIAATNFQARAHVVSGAIPERPICGCVQKDLPVLKPLRWLHIPSNERFAFSLLCV